MKNTHQLFTSVTAGLLLVLGIAFVSRPTEKGDEAPYNPNAHAGNNSPLVALRGGERLLSGTGQKVASSIEQGDARAEDIHAPMNRLPPSLLNPSALSTSNRLNWVAIVASNRIVQVDVFAAVHTVEIAPLGQTNVAQAGQIGIHSVSWAAGALALNQAWRICLSVGSLVVLVSGGCWLLNKKVTIGEWVWGA